MKRLRKIKIVMNPAYSRPAHQITDRAKRYRANAKENRPLDPRQCGFCGRKKNVGVHHVDGNEDDGAPDNLLWACKKCNGKVGTLLRRAGLGRLTRQYNPRASGGKRQQMEAYGAAIKVMRGEFDGDVAKAVATIRATPRHIRSAFTSRSWPVRRQKYGPSGRQASLFGEVPF